MKKQKVFAKASWHETKPVLELMTKLNSLALNEAVHHLNQSALSQTYETLSTIYLRLTIRMAIILAKKAFDKKNSYLIAELRQFPKYLALHGAAEYIADFQNIDPLGRSVTEAITAFQKLLESDGRYRGSLKRYLVEVVCPVAEVWMLI